MNFNKLVEIAYALCDWRKHLINSFHVSFLLRRTKILSIGINSARTHPINLRNKKFNRDGRDISGEKFCCSELTCLNKSKNQNIKYNKCKVVNIRIDKNGNLVMSAPCISCRSLLNFYKISEVFHTTDSGGFARQIIN